MSSLGGPTLKKKKKTICKPTSFRLFEIQTSPDFRSPLYSVQNFNDSWYFFQRFLAPRQRYRYTSTPNSATHQLPQRIWRVSTLQGTEIHGLYCHQVQCDPMNVRYSVTHERQVQCDSWASKQIPSKEQWTSQNSSRHILQFKRFEYTK